MNNIELDQMHYIYGPANENTVDEQNVSGNFERFH